MARDNVRVYQITLNNQLNKDFVFKEQLRKTALSISSNIAEGFERNSKEEFIQFLSISRGSLGELRSPIISKDIFEELNNKCLSLSKKIRCFIKYLKNRNPSKLFVLLLICNLHLTICNLLFSAFQNTDWSVRAEAMGGVFTAISDEPFGVYYNPSGSAFVESNYIQIMYSKPYLGFKGVEIILMGIGGMFRTKYVSLGLNYGNYNIENSLYSEHTIVLNFSKNLNEIHYKLLNLSFGMNLKYLIKKYTYDDEILSIEPELQSKSSKSALSFDFGAIYKFLDEKISVGFAIKDLNQPDIAVLDKNQDIIPITVSFGSTYNFGDIKAGFDFEDVTVGVELRYRNQEWGDENTKLFYALGVETFLNFRTIAIRTGINRNSISLGFGYYGLKVAGKVKIGFNYSFSFSTVFFDNLGNHKFVFDINF